MTLVFFDVIMGMVEVVRVKLVVLPHCRILLFLLLPQALLQRARGSAEVPLFVLGLCLGGVAITILPSNVTERAKLQGLSWVSANQRYQATGGRGDSSVVEFVLC